MGALDGLRVLSFEARRADELATMLARHGGSVRRAPVLPVPVYRWALPEDTGPLHAGAAAVVRGEADVAVFTNGAQVEHLFRAAADEVALRAGLGRTVVASVGPVCSEVLEAHGVHPDL